MFIELIEEIQEKITKYCLFRYSIDHPKFKLTSFFCSFTCREEKHLFFSIEVYPVHLLFDVVAH